MSVVRFLKIGTFFAIVLAFAGATVVRADYSFKVHNNTDHKIVSLLASEHGEEPGEFNIGDGIKAGEATTLTWDKSTDNSNCEWAFTAVYDDGTYSEPVVINFCEDDLELVFDE